MARIRYLKPGFFTDEDLGNLPLESRLTFAGLWCYADKSGRLEDRPKFLKAMIFPYDDIDMDLQLQNLSKIKKNGKPFINRYTTDGQDFIQILNWDEHQRPHHTEAPSKLPPSSKTPIIKGPLIKEPLDNGEITVRQRQEKEKGKGKEKGSSNPLIGRAEENDNGKGAFSEKLKDEDRHKETFKQIEKLRLILSANGTWKKASIWAQMKIQLQYHPEAVLLALQRVNEFKPNAPEAYADQVLLVESQNKNEADHIAKSEELKKTGPQSIREALQGAITNAMPREVP